MNPDFLRGFAAATLAAMLAATALADQAEPQRLDRALEGWMVGNFSLVDQHGNAFTQEHLKDRWTFLLLGDTHCNEPCTAALSALAGMLRRIARADAVKTTQVLFVSLDPNRDTPAKLGSYLADFDAHFVGATASRETLARLVEDLSPPGAPSGEGKKAGNLLLIGPDAIVRGEFLPPYDVLRLTEGFMKARIGR
jgi:protein SCO1/2